MFPLFYERALKGVFNFSRIIFISLPGKVCARVLERRVHSLVELQIQEEQCSFHSGCGPTDQLFTFTKVLESAWEFAQPVRKCFVDLEKSYNHVPQDVMCGQAKIKLPLKGFWGKGFWAMTED